MTELEAYLEGLTVTQGSRAGERFTVLPWQRKFLRGAFRDGVAEAGLSIARGNGKSTLLAGIAAAAVAGPLVQRRAETVIVASSFQQSRIIFEHTLAFLADEIQRQPGRYRVMNSVQHAVIEDKETGARIRAVASDPRRIHGIAPVLILADELSQWPPSTGERMLAALRTAAGKIPGCRLLAIGTRPASGEHYFARMLTSADYSQLHAAGPDEPPFRKSTWAKANPSLPAMPDLEVAIRREAGLAKKDPAALASYKALRLNLGTADTQRAELISAETWQECERHADADGEVICGLDLGGTSSLCGVALYWPKTGRLEAFALAGDNPTPMQRGLADGVHRLYQDAVHAGTLRLAPGRVVPAATVLKHVLEVAGRPAAICADRWRISELEDGLDAAGIDCELIARGMGFHHGGEDVRLFREAALSSEICAVPGNMLLRSALAEAVTISDAAGNAKLAKISEGGRRMRARDDIACAAILAVAEGVRRRRSRPVVKSQFFYQPARRLAW